MARSYSQFCGLAHALDLVGERWTLLIVRELLVGPRRYSDLRDGLVNVPSNLLATRLREMQANGLLRRRRLPAPAASVVVYELTEEGQELGDAVAVLARWGMRTLPASTQGMPFRSQWLVLALGARFVPSAARGVSESYEFRIEGQEVVSFEVLDGEGRARMGPASDPVVRVSADADTFAALSVGAPGALDPDDGARIEGDPAAVTRMLEILAPPRAPA